MYQSIYDYAKNRHLIKEKHRCKRTISAYVILDINGDYCGSEVVPKKERTAVTVPDTGKYYTAGMACPICDKKSTIFGNKKHDSWVQLMRTGAEYCEEFDAINRFIAKDDFKDVFEDILNVKDDEFISFRVDGKNIEELDTWQEWFDAIMDAKDNSKKSDEKGISIISANKVDVISGSTKFPMCRGGSVFGTGVPIYSNSHKRESGVACSFRSYGLGSEACPMSIAEAETIQAGLEKLFNSEHNCSREHSLIYWLDHDSTVFDEVTSMTLRRLIKLDAIKEKQFKNLLSSMLSGELITEEMKKYSDDLFHMIEYKTPDKGRFVLYEDNVEPYHCLLENISRWYKDTTLNIGNSSLGFITNIYSVFMSLLENKDSSNTQQAINGQFGNIRADFIKAFMFGGTIPEQLYQYALRQADRSIVHGYYRSDMDTDVKKEIIRKYSPKTALRIMKVYLIRKGNSMSENLNTTETNSGYLCGRLLAAVEKLQLDANWNEGSCNKIVVTIADRMYKGFEKDTGRLVNECITESRHYFQKLRRSPGKEGTEIYYHRLIDDIVGAFAENGGIPKKLSQDELGFFHIGYALQRQELFKKKKNGAENSEAIDNDENMDI